MSSVLVPKVSSPFLRTDTLASHRKLPSSMLPSHISRYMRISRRDLRYAVASAGVLRSGSLTISRSGVLDRL